MDREVPEKEASSRRNRRVTAQDVALMAGVSRSAVSRAFTEGAYLDGEKRERVLAAAKELGYRPNALAAGLQGARSNLVAIFAGDMRNDYDRQAMSSLVAGLNTFGKWPVVVDGSQDSARNALSTVLSLPLDALVVRSGSIDSDLVEQCGKLNIPMISSGRVLDAPKVDSVCLRNRQGTLELTNHLLKAGHNKIAFIGGPEHLSSANERRAGVVTALKENGHQLMADLSGDYTIDSGYDAAQKICRGPMPDAIIAANDAMAIGCMSSLLEAGHKVPDTCAVVGFDDMDMSHCKAFDLTTIRNPIEQMVQAVVDLLEQRLANPDKAPETRWIEPELVLRGTH